MRYDKNLWRKRDKVGGGGGGPPAPTRGESCLTTYHHTFSQNASHQYEHDTKGGPDAKEQTTLDGYEGRKDPVSCVKHGRKKTALNLFISNVYSPVGLSANVYSLGNISSPVGNIVSNNCCHISGRQSVGAAIFDIRISGYFLWFTTVLWTYK
jgi:hypothetical protein